MAVVASRGHLVFNSTSMSEAQLLQGWPWKDRSQWVYSENGRHFRIPLTDKEEGIGYVLFYPTEPQLMKVEEGLFHQAAEIISYQMSFVYKEFVDHSVQNDLGYLLSRYLKGNGTIEALTEGAERLGIKLFEGSYQCVLAAVPPEIPESDRSKWLRDLREELKFHPELKNKQVIHFRIGEGEFSIFFRGFIFRERDAPGPSCQRITRPARSGGRHTQALAVGERQKMQAGVFAEGVSGMSGHAADCRTSRNSRSGHSIRNGGACLFISACARPENATVLR